MIIALASGYVDSRGGSLAMVLKLTASRIYRRVTAGASIIIVAFTSLVFAETVNATPITGQGTWETTLLGRAPLTAGGTDFQAYYDTIRDITWVADANLAMTSGFDADGKMTWDQTMSWITFLNTSAHLGVNVWKLASALNSDGTIPSNGFSSGDNLMNFMYGTTLGNTYGTGGGPIVFDNSGPFSGIQSNNYWLSTETCGFSNCTIARRFNFGLGQLTNILVGRLLVGT